jgi:carboxymethylenebutenolidase
MNSTHQSLILISHDTAIGACRRQASAKDDAKRRVLSGILFLFFINLVVLLTPISTEAAFSNVSFPSGSETVNARWSEPSDSESHPVVILIHEWWGLNQWVERKGENLVQNGFAVLAVDLYRGRATADKDEAHELMRGLPEDRALRDLSAAVDFLKKQNKDRKIGVLGWCMGGGFAVKLATTRPDLSACVIYYGSLPTDKDALIKIACPVIGFFGAEDRGIPIDSIRQFEEALQSAGKKVTIKIYEKAGHAFMNEDRPSYNKAASVDSWKRCITFLSNHLKSSK